MVVTSFVAMLLGMSNMFARYSFALARAGILPRRLSTVTHRQAPARAALANGLIVAALLITFFAVQADPMVHIYAWSVALGTIGFILIMAIASIAVFAFFARRHRSLGEDVLSTIIAPIIALVLVVAMLIFAVANYDALLLGSGSTAKWLLLALPVAAAAGVFSARRSKTIDFDTHPIEADNQSNSMSGTQQKAPPEKEKA